MAKVIVADENEGRRTLLANTLEREGFDITRAGTLRQAEGTALVTMPEIVLLEGDWKNGDAIDAAQRLMGDPEFAFKCRIVVLSRNTSQEYLVSAAKAGISEVIAKPIDMKVLIEQLNKHARKQFVPPPADVEGPNFGGGSFDVSMLMGDSTWALPMLKGLVGPEKINPGFIDEILVGGAHDWLWPLIAGMSLTLGLKMFMEHLKYKYLLRTRSKIDLVTSSGFFWHLLSLPEPRSD